MKGEVIASQSVKTYLTPNMILSFDYNGGYLPIQKSKMPPKLLNSPVAVVHCISKAWCVYDGQRELDAPLLYQHFGLFHLKAGPQVVTTGCMT